MLRRELRLLSPISKETKSLNSEGFSVKFLENGLPNSRFAFIVSKRVDKRAVVRNRAKRIIRSVIEEKLTNIKEGYDFLFVLKKNIIGKERDQVERELLEILKKNNLYA